MTTSNSQYLNHYAEPEARAPAIFALSERFSRTPWDFAVVIPSLGEDLSGIIKSIEASASYCRITVITIIVVNERVDHRAELRERNQLYLSQFEFPRGESIYFNSPAQLIIDRVTLPFPSKQGVGLARKIGCDIAFTLFNSGAVKGRWIFTTDADCEVPKDYFRLNSPPGTSAVVFPFEHSFDFHRPLEAEALRRYDRSIRDYAEGLRFAGSPYAYHSLGSTLAISAEDYALVRGFPKRDAAEDFYLLNKLAKVGTIHSGAGIPIRIHQRVSDRVPFGTGVATMKIARDLNETGKTSYPLHYSLEAFKRLKEFLEALELTASSLENRLNELDPIFVARGAEEAVAIALRTRRSSLQVKRHLHDWFDALKTLQYVKRLSIVADGSSAR